MPGTAHESLDGKRKHHSQWACPLLAAMVALWFPFKAQAEPDATPRPGPAQTNVQPALHPVPRDALQPGAPQPQWNVGWLVGVCGVGKDHLWQGTDFCGAVLGEALWLRKRETSFGLGAYSQLGTSGFFDFRASLGMATHAPLGIFALSLRGGPYLHTFAEGAAPGVEGYLEFGLRSLNFSGRYALTHGLVTGVQHTPGSGSRAGTTLWIALRLDAFWLAAPFGALFRSGR